MLSTYNVQIHTNTRQTGNHKITTQTSFNNTQTLPSHHPSQPSHPWGVSMSIIFPKRLISNGAHLNPHRDQHRVTWASKHYCQGVCWLCFWNKTTTCFKSSVTIYSGNTWYHMDIYNIHRHQVQPNVYDRILPFVQQSIPPYASLASWSHLPCIVVSPFASGSQVLW